MKRDIFVEKKVTVGTLQHFSILVAGCQNEAGNAVQWMNVKFITNQTSQKGKKRQIS